MVAVMQSDITSQETLPARRASVTAAVRFATQPLMSPTHWVLGAQPPLDESGRLRPITSIMERVAGGACKQKRRLFELVGAGPGHDPLIPIAGLRAAVPVVEQE